MSDDHFADAGNMVRRVANEILHRIVAPEEGDIVPVVTAENAQEIAAEAARAIAALILEERGRAFSEGRAVANGERRMCVICGKTAPADQVQQGDYLTECISYNGMAACIFDTTPQEAWEHWSKQWHELHQSLPTIRASARREALEEAAKWHDERAERTRRTLERGMSLAMRDTLDTVAYHHEQYAAAIRSLAKEAPDAE